MQRMPCVGSGGTVTVSGAGLLRDDPETWLERAAWHALHLCRAAMSSPPSEEIRQQARYGSAAQRASGACGRQGFQIRHVCQHICRRHR
jgi:hypothetical protein